MRIALTGADGMLGQALMARLADHDLCALTEPSFSLEDREGVLDALAGAAPEWVVHTAAMTNVDGCEQNPTRAYRINAMGTRYVAEACARCGAGLVYISTDFVFGPRRMRRPIEAWETGDPLSAYGLAKWGGERFVEALAPRWIIARTAWLYGEGGTHFVGTILKKAREGLPLRVVNDQTGCPTYARDVAEGVDALLQREAVGWFHLVNTGEATWFELARRTVELAGLDPDGVQPCTSEDVARPAPRPAYSVLSTLTYREATGGDLRPWSDALKDYLTGGAGEERRPSLCPSPP
ncbi:dTDP-4-dehydrorhamnose reductase [Candidatus Fermentibacteria bacterium]|nr:dTDP-4-dehydrorhamnose reductase [Candidatus Fermentibacteria bacterium]